jgi:hypothetical protein
MAKEPAVEPIAAEPEVAKPAAAPSLDLKDLGLVLNLINVSIKRGTFEPQELRSVLDVYDKLESFLKFQAQLQAAAIAAQKGEA